MSDGILECLSCFQKALINPENPLMPYAPHYDTLTIGCILSSPRIRGARRKTKGQDLGKHSVGYLFSKPFSLV